MLNVTELNDSDPAATADEILGNIDILPGTPHNVCKVVQAGLDTFGKGDRE